MELRLPQATTACEGSTPGQRHVCFEKGTRSGWLYEILEPHAVEVVVAGVRAGSRGPKDDKRDAFLMAEDLVTRNSKSSPSSRATTIKPARIHTTAETTNEAEAGLRDGALAA